MSTAARRRWNGRSLSVDLSKSSSVEWIGSSSSRRRGVFKKSVATQQPLYISTWHTKNYWSLIMRGGGIRRRSQQSRREERREGPLYVPWLSSRLSWITCHTRFPLREADSEVSESGGSIHDQQYPPDI